MFWLLIDSEKRETDTGPEAGADEPFSFLSIRKTKQKVTGQKRKCAGFLDKKGKMPEKGVKNAPLPKNGGAAFFVGDYSPSECCRSLSSFVKEFIAPFTLAAALLTTSWKLPENSAAFRSMEKR